VVGGNPGTQAAVGVARLHQAMGRVDGEAEPGDARGDRYDLGAGLVDDQTQPGEALDDRPRPGPKLPFVVAEEGKIIYVAQG
jgi:hypothetical protein